jgi:TetR/AcrR family transcriptional regulator, mexJK operon transcriptional repressor
MAETITTLAPPTSPRLEARRQAFIDAATAAFLEKGYANTTLDDIIARSGGSRQTLYALFGGKQGLFSAIIAERCQRIFGALAEDTLRDREPEDVLRNAGIHYLEAVTNPQALGIYRLVVAEGASMPELAERFWNAGPGSSRSLLARYFKTQSARGVLTLPDAEQAAHQFWAMLLGNFQLPCLLGLRPSPDRAEIESYVTAAVEHFMHGCRPK